MKNKGWLILVFLALVPVGCGTSGLSLAEREALVPGPAPNRIVELRLNAELPELPAQGRELQLWVPLIQTDAHQIVTDRQVHSLLRPMVRYGPAYGNAMMYFSGDEPLPGHVETELVFRIELHRCTPDLQGTPLSEQQRTELEPYLQTSVEEDALKQTAIALAERLEREQGRDNTALQAEHARLVGKLERLTESNTRLREVAAGLASSEMAPQQLTRVVYDHVLAKLTPAQEPVETERTLFEAYRAGSVTPLEYVRITVFLLRSVGIPARVESGVLLPETFGTEPVELTGPHLWVGGFIAPAGWVAIDPLAALANPERTDYYFGTECAGRIRFGSGTGIQLAPQQTGDPLPFFYQPRAEVDGKVVPLNFTLTATDLLTAPLTEDAGRGSTKP